jgi:hypothetical protein
MDTLLLIAIDGKYYDLDLYDDLPITANYSITNITELQERNSAYSNTFTIPGTKKNKERFNSFFNISGIDFDPTQKIDCVIQYQGADVLRGTLRLNAVINTKDYQEFEVYVVSNVGDFVGELEGLELTDLDWNDLNHQANYDNIFLSWSATTGDTQGLFGGKILYPFTHHGYDYSGSTPQFTFDLTSPYSFTASTYAVPESYFKPSVRVKEVISRIFDKTSYLLKSDFFDTPYFRSIYMSLADNGELRINGASGLTNQNVFKVLTDCFTGVLIGPSNNSTIVPFPFFNRFTDPLNNFTTSKGYTFPFSCTEVWKGQNETNNYFQAPLPGSYSFQFRFSFQKAVSQILFNFQRFSVSVRKSTNKNNLINGTEVFRQSFTAQGSNRQDANLFITTTLATGEYIGIFIDFDTNDPLLTNDRTIRFRPFSNESILYWELYDSPTSLPSLFCDVKAQLPSYKCIDYLKDIIKMFNLLVIEDVETKTIELIPYNWFYNDADRAQKDWTDKLSLDNSWRVSPLDFTLNKNVNFSYEPGSEELLNQYHENTTGRIFGTYNYTSTSNILSGEENIGVGFAPVPTAAIPGSEDFIIPYWTDLNGPENNQIPTQLKKPHIFFWVGNRFCSINAQRTNYFTWYLQSGGTNVELTTYPAISHLSRLGVLNETQFADLNWGRTYDYLADRNNQINIYSRYDLFTAFYNDLMIEKYSPEARKLEGKFYLTPEDFRTFRYNDKIFIKDNNFRIQEISGANLLEGDLVDCILIKELGGFDKFNLPVPNYNILPNQSTTPPPSSISINWYVENNLNIPFNANVSNLIATIYKDPNFIMTTNIVGSSVVNSLQGTHTYRLQITWENGGGGNMMNLRLGLGLSSGDFSLAKTDIPFPSFGQTYSVEYTAFIPASTNIYFQIDTY